MPRSDERGTISKVELFGALLLLFLLTALRSLGLDLLCFISRNLANEDIAPADFAAVRLELNRPLRPQRLGAVPEVFHLRMVHHQFVVQVNRGDIAGLNDTELIPFAEWLVSQNERIFSGCTSG